MGRRFEALLGLLIFSAFAGHRIESGPGWAAGLLVGFAVAFAIAFAVDDLGGSK